MNNYEHLNSTSGDVELKKFEADVRASLGLPESKQATPDPASEDATEKKLSQVELAKQCLSIIRQAQQEAKAPEIFMQECNDLLGRNGRVNSK